MESKHIFGENVGKCIMDTAHKIKFCLNGIFEQAGLTGLQARILGFIRINSEKGRDIFQRDIEAEFKISRSSVSSVLDNMEKNGFIHRLPVKNDARLKKIVLSEKSQQISQQHCQTIINFENSLLENMTAEEISTLKTLLNKVSENIKNTEV